MAGENRFLAALAVSAALAGAGRISAQTSAVLGPSNAAFIEGLLRVGFVEEAEKISQLVAASSLPDAEKKKVDVVYTRLQIALKTRSGDAMGRRELVLKQLGERAEAMRATALADFEATADAVGNWVEQYRLLADALVEALAQEQDPEKVATLRKESDEQFGEAIKELEAKKKAAEEVRSDEKELSELPLLASFYGLGRLQYYHSLIHPADSVQSQRYAEAALNTLEEFDLDFSDSLAAFEAKLTAALCQQRLGKADAALTTCDDAIALRERFDRGKDNVWRVEPAAADVIAAATLQKAMLLEDRKEHQKIVELARDYFTTVAHAMTASAGLAVLAAEAKAHLELGENEAATKLAQQLVEADPRGEWGRRGQQLLAQLIAGGGGKGVDASRTLRLAESVAVQGDHDQGLRLCREVLAHAGPGEEEVAAEAMLITGAIFATRGWLHEASVAFDAVVRRWPKSKHAPDALYRALRCFDELDESKKIGNYRRWFDDRSKQLARDYPDDPRVPQLQLFEGDRLERKQQFLQAAKVYEAIPPSESSIYLEARFRAANCNLRHARSLNNPKEAEPFSAKALAGFESVLRDVENNRLAATDAKVRARLDQVEFTTRVALTNLLLGDKARLAEAEEVLKKINVGDGDAQAPVIWALRIRLQMAKDALDEAASTLDAAMAKASDSRPLIGVSRSLATALDNASTEKEKAGDRLASITLRRRSVGFYIRGASTATPTETAQIADRLLVLGMLDNNLPKEVESWAEVPNYQPQPSAAWDGALQLYQRLAESDSLTYKTHIGMARVLGFMQRWNDAESELAKLFSTEKIAGAKGRLDTAVLGRKPELLTAYLEWGFTLLSATGGDVKGRRARATEIFQRIHGTAPQDGRHWWLSRFGLIQSLYDRGVYEEADVSMKSLERTNPGFDNDRFGLKGRLRILQLEIAQKIPK